MDLPQSSVVDLQPQSLNKKNGWGVLKVFLIAICFLLVGMFVMMAMFQTRAHALVQEQIAVATMMQVQAERAKRVMPNPSDAPTAQLTPTRPWGEALTQSTPVAPSNTTAGPNLFPTPEDSLAPLVHQWRSTSGPQQEQLQLDITKRVTDQFEAMHRAHEAQLNKLRSDMQQTQELLDKRQQLKSQIIERRVKQLTGQADVLEWNPTAVSPEVIYPPRNPSVLTAPTLQHSPADSVAPDVLYAPSIPSVPTATPTVDQTIYSQADTTYRATTSRDVESTSNLTQPIEPKETIEPKDKSISNSSIATRSFMQIGFKIKQLQKNLKDEDSIRQLPMPSKRSIELRNYLEETLAVWTFEKNQQFKEEELAIREKMIIQKQIIAVEEQLERVVTQIRNGTVSQSELAQPQARLADLELQNLKNEAKRESVEAILQWMNEFERNYIHPPKEPAEENTATPNRSE